MEHSPINGILFETRQNAENVIDKLNENIELYGETTVADLYEVTGLISGHNDDNYGWVDISSASVKIDKYGYELIIGTPIKLK